VACLFWSPAGVIARIAFFSALLLILFCIIDGVSLRGEIKKLVGEPHLPVHAGVYTRLQKSTHGVGVFAIRDIPAETNVFAGDKNEMRDIDEKELTGIEPEIKQLYDDDFCPRKGGKLKGPTNFNNLTVAWYLSHSNKPNVRCDDNFDFISTRVIKQGEELTADYTTYDQKPLNFVLCARQPK
jgi:SET domain